MSPAKTLPDSSHICCTGDTASAPPDSAIVSVSKVNVLEGARTHEKRKQSHPDRKPWQGSRDQIHAAGHAGGEITLATNERYKDKDGQWQDRTEWHNIVLWERLAEIAGEYLKKGGKVYIEGRIRTDSWDDKTNRPKKIHDRNHGQRSVLAGGRGEGGAGGTRGSSRGASTSSGGNNFDQSAPEPEHAPAGSSPITDEDIPF